MPKKVKPGAPTPDPNSYTGGVIEYNRAAYFDPGDRYTGVAIFERDPDDDTWDCVDAFTWDAEKDGINLLQSFFWTATARGEWDIIGYEVWRLFEDKAQEQKGKEFIATQIIGVIKWAHRMHEHQNRWPRQPMEIVRFLPEHKKPTAGKLKKMGWTYESDRRKAHGDHAKDAELQGAYDIIHNRGWTLKRKAPKNG